MWVIKGRQGQRNPVRWVWKDVRWKSREWTERKTRGRETSPSQWGVKPEPLMWQGYWDTRSKPCRSPTCVRKRMWTTASEHYPWVCYKRSRSLQTQRVGKPEFTATSVSVLACLKLEFSRRWKLSSFAHPCVITNVPGFLSSVEHKSRCFAKCTECSFIFYNGLSTSNMREIL